MGWQPLATSTPFKINPTSKNNELPQQNLIQPAELMNNLLNRGSSFSSNILLQENHQNPKKACRRKVSKFFDVSSSSDNESNDSYISPGIKILSENFSKARPAPKSRKPKREIASSEEIYTHGNKTNKDYSISNKIKKKSTLEKGVKGKFSNLSTPSQLTENKILPENQKNMTIEKENCLKNKINNKSKPKMKSKTKVLKNKNCERLKKKNSDVKNPSINLKSPEILVLKEINDKFKSFDNEKKSSGALHFMKHRISAPYPKGSLAKKVRKKLDQTEVKNESALQLEQCIFVKDTTKNISHQLFSVSKEQELINSLDLTKGDHKEDNYNLKFLFDSCHQSSFGEPFKLKSKGSKSTVKLREKLASLQEGPKQFLLPETLFFEKDNEKLQKKINNFKSFKKSSNEIVEFLAPKSLKNNSKDEIISVYEEQVNGYVENLMESVENHKKSPSKTDKVEHDRQSKYDKIKKRKANKSESENHQDIVDIQKTSCSVGELNPQLPKRTKKIKREGEKILTSSLLKNSRRNTRSATNGKNPVSIYNKKNDVQKKFIEKKSSNPNEIIPEILEKKENSKVCEALSNSVMSVTDVFKQFNNLSFSKEKQQGCFTAECWSLKNLKCGLFKLSKKSHVTSKTVYTDSYFGSAVIKGSIKMKIGSKKLGLKEGDMAFVPPLTIWSAVNPFDNDAILYYWSSRLKT